LTYVAWALVGFNKKKIFKVKGILKIIYIENFGWINNINDTWHNLNVQFKYATIVDFILVKISILLLIRLKCHMYNIFKTMTNHLLPHGV
jgi:hypothetical protein